MRWLKTFAIALLLASGIARQSEGAVIHVWPKLRAVLDENFERLDPSTYHVDGDVVHVRPSGDMNVLQVDFLMTITDLREDQVGFGNLAFDIHVVGGRQSSELPGWLPDDSTVDMNGDATGGLVPKWAGLGDADYDLMRLVAETAPRIFGLEGIDPRRTLGIAPFNNPNVDLFDRPVVPHDDGEYMGTVLIEFDSLASARPVEITSDVIAGNTYNAELMLSNVGVFPGPNRTLIVIVPEPSSVMLFFVSAAGGSWLLRGACRRPVTRLTAPVSWGRALW